MSLKVCRPNLRPESNRRLPAWLAGRSDEASSTLLSYVAMGTAVIFYRYQTVLLVRRGPNPKMT